MSAKLVFTLLGCTSLFLVGCTQKPSVDIRSEAEALRSIEAQWTAANKARDMNTILSIVAPDIAFMYADSPSGVGLEAFRKSTETWLADTAVSRTYSCTVEAVEVAASGELAYTRGTNWYSHSTPKGLVAKSDKWVTVYRKIDGKWRAIVDIGTPVSQ
jgi:uncharacterized protein (TIGR02246 family)